MECALEKMASAYADNVASDQHALAQNQIRELHCPNMSECLFLHNLLHNYEPRHAKMGLRTCADRVNNGMLRIVCNQNVVLDLTHLCPSMKTSHV